MGGGKSTTKTDKVGAVMKLTFKLGRQIVKNKKETKFTIRSIMKLLRVIQRRVT